MGSLSRRMAIPLLVLFSPWPLLYGAKKLNIGQYVKAGTALLDTPFIDLPALLVANTSTPSTISNFYLDDIRTDTSLTSAWNNISANTGELKILVGVELLHQQHLSVVSKTFQSPEFQVEMFVNIKTEEDLNFAKEYPFVRGLSQSRTTWKTIYIAMLTYVADWYLKCPSSTYVNPQRLRSLLDEHSEEKPLHLKFRLSKSKTGDSTDVRCEVWNRRAAIILKSTISDYDTIVSTERAASNFAAFANVSNIEQIDLGFIPSVNSPCDGNFDTRATWMYPNMFSTDVLISSWSRYLAVAYPGDFQHPFNCSCQVSPISHEVQQCGPAPWKKRNCTIRPRCPYSMLDDDQTDMMATHNIPSYVITLDVNTTNQRVQQYLPANVFRGQAMQGIRAKPGITGYRHSVRKALTLGLETTTAPVLAVFDDDFRITKDFEARWTEITHPTSTCYHHTLSKGGFFLMGMTVHSDTYWRHILTHPKQYLHGSTETSRCTDGSSFMRGSFATLFSRKGAQLAVKWLDATPDDRPFDWFWMDIVELGYPVRGAVYPLFVADVNHTSLVDPTRDQKRVPKATVYDRHIKHRWGEVSGYVP